MIRQHKYKNIISDWRNLSLKNVVKYVLISICSFIFLGILIFIFFHNPLINTFLKDRFTKSFNEANPGYSLKLGDMHYNIWDNRLGSDSVSLNSTDSSISYNTASISVSGINWINILFQRDFRIYDLNSALIDVQVIRINFHQSKKELKLKSLYVSINDSLLVADSIKYYLLNDDEQFFSESQFRRTRYRLNIPQIKAYGIDYLELLNGTSYKARNINVNDMFADILVNMDKPYDTTSTKPLMPNEIFSSLKKTIKIDSMKIINSQLKYCERYAVNASPGVITFDKVNISFFEISNHSAIPDTASIYADGIFMNKAQMNLLMKIPLTSKEFSFQYNGSLSSMDLSGLNTFLIPAEFHRINSGVIESASFDINVNSGHASGSLHAAYKDLSISILNKETGSQDGIFDRIASIAGKLFVIRGTNMPDKNGKLEIGEIKYTRNPDDYFLQFVWFALRSGVGDVIGF